MFWDSLKEDLKFIILWIKKKENKGSLISSVGGLFTIIGMTLLAMDNSAILYLSFTILGVILAAYGVFVMLKAGQKEEENKK